MELGATVCTPRAPDCPACPLGDDCKARALGAAESFPARAQRTPGKRVLQLLAFVERDRQLLLFRRSGAAGQLAGLWEFPLVERSAETAPEALLASRYSGSWVLGAPIARLRHAITTSTFDIEVRRASFRARDDLVCEADRVAPTAPITSEAGWWDIAAVGELALTGVARKVLARAGIQPG